MAEKNEVLPSPFQRRPIRTVAKWIALAVYVINLAMFVFVEHANGSGIMAIILLLGVLHIEREEQHEEIMHALKLAEGVEHG